VESIQNSTSLKALRKSSPMHHTGVILHTVKSVSNSEKLPLFLNEHEAQNATMEELPNRRLELSFEEMELTLDKI
jgi:hypothetical protein